MKPSFSDRMFLAGVLTALAVIEAHGEDTMFDEIVRATGEAELLAEARKSGNMRWSGMSRYLRRKS